MAQVPDCDVTNEWWLLEACKPVSVEVRWLGMFSVMFEEKYSVGKHAIVFACTSINWLQPVENMNHPWLNGRGHVLESSEDEGNPEGVEG